jgi:hypothetical protein
MKQPTHMPGIAMLLMLALWGTACTKTNSAANSRLSPATGHGSATLSWNAPSKNTDGSSNMDIAGYHIYYGTDPGSLTQRVDVKGAQSTTYRISGLAPGTYYFAVKAYNSAGAESIASNLGSKTL